MRTFQHFNISTLQRAALALFLFAASATVAYPQTTLLTGTFKTPEGKTPAQANLKSSATIGATPIYGKAYFRATDVAGNQLRELTYNNATYVGEALGFIKSDGTLISYAETSGVNLLRTDTALPSGLAYCLELQWNGSTDGRVGPQVIKGKNLCKAVNVATTVDWATLPVASIVSPSYGYQTSIAGAIADYEKWTRYAAASVPPAASGVDNVFIDTADLNLKAKDSAGAVRNLGSAGAGDITDVGNCATGACFQAAAINTVLAGPASGGAGIAALRALVAADIPALSALSGAVTDAQVPNNITVDLATLATTATTANAGDSATAFFSSGLLEVAVGGTGANLSATGGANQFLKQSTLGGAVTVGAIADADVPNNITIDLATLATTASTANAGDSATAFFAAGQIEAARGGTGMDSSASTGIPHVSAGTWSVSALVDADVPDDLAITITGTAEEITVTGSDPPVLSIPAVLNLSTKTLKGGSPLVFEGLTADAFETTLVVTDPTAARNFTLPNADSVAVQQITCGGTDKVSAVSALGVVTCSADQTGGGANHNLLSATHPDTVAASPVLGDVLFGNATPAWNKLAGNITTTKKYLSQTGNGSVSAAPAWSQPAFSELSGSAANSQLDSDLAALGDNATNGLWTRTGAGTGAARTLTGSANEIVIANGDGVAGNPTFTVGSLVVQTDQANTYTGGGLQDFGTSTVKAAGFETATATPPSLSGVPGVCAVSAASEVKLCGSSANNRFAESYNGGAYVNHALTTDILYPIYFGANRVSLTAPADATNYYLSVAQEFTTNDTQQNTVLVGIAGTVTKFCAQTYVNGTLGSNEDVTFSLRKNNATESTETGTQKWDVAATTGFCVTLTTAFTVAANDRLAIHILTPTWITNPANVFAQGVAFVRP